MADTYTLQVTDYFFDILEQDIARVWEDITSTPEDTTAELWEKKLSRIADNYSLTSRFALMRILWARSRKDPEALLEIPAQGEAFIFQDVTLEHAGDLTPEENQSYLTLLTRIAASRTDSDPKIDDPLIFRAWNDRDAAKALLDSRLPELRPKALRSARAANKAAVKAAFQRSFSRDDALQLGHILGFSYQEMQWYLLRVFDTGDCFRFNDSDDLIEAYGFLTGLSWQGVQLLKDAYADRTADMEAEEVDGRDANWTKSVTDTFFEKVSQWQKEPDTMDQKFLSWLLLQAPGLDRPSRTAARIYRNLAVYAYDLVMLHKRCPMEEDLPDIIRDLCRSGLETTDVRARLYENGALSPKLCYDLVSELLLTNQFQAKSVIEDKTKAWRILTTEPNGNPTATGGLINSSRTRVLDVLTDRVQAEKGDLLYLLWFTANMIWQASGDADASGLCCRLFDFMDAARVLLKAALLSEFYPPHPMEQAMLLSIVCDGQDSLDASAVYEAMLLTVKDGRKRKSGVKHKTREERQAIITHYLEHKEESSVAQCAARFGISEQTLSTWLSKYQAEAAQNTIRA